MLVGHQRLAEAEAEQRRLEAEGAQTLGKLRQLREEDDQLRAGARQGGCLCCLLACNAGAVC